MRMLRYNVSLGRGKNLVFNKGVYMFKNTKSGVKGVPEKSGSRIQVQKEVEERYNLAWWRSTKKGSRTFRRIERKALVRGLALHSYQGSLHGLPSSRYEAERRPYGQVVSTKRAAIEESYRCRKNVCGERIEQGREKIVIEHLGKRERSNFCDFENYARAPVRKKRLSALNKASTATFCVPN